MPFSLRLALFYCMRPQASSQAFLFSLTNSFLEADRGFTASLASARRSGPRATATTGSGLCKLSTCKPPITFSDYW